jgi:GT2 family glycosyltransferase
VPEHRAGRWMLSPFAISNLEPHTLFVILMPQISVIILNWNGKHFLEDCLGAIRRQTFRDFEAILVDNGSTDGSVEYVRRQFPEVTLLALSNNLGFAGGNIAGYDQARGSIVALLNNDTEAHPDWLAEIHKASQTYPDAGSFASKMMYFDERGRVENCGFDVGIAGSTIDLGRDEADGPGWCQPRKVFGACGGAVAYRRGMLQEIGFLDPDFFMTYEDVDLSFRAQLRGFACVYVPGAIVYHRYRATNRKTPFRQVFYSQRNIEFVYLKNMPLALILRALPQRLVYELGAAIYFSKKGDGWAFLRAKLDVLKCLPSILRKRREIQNRRTITDRQMRKVLRKSFFLNKWKKLWSLWAQPHQDRTKDGQENC